ncbi:hypothetical protein ACKLNR_010978 [Fusarium oxysporum f. sp. zingiberi]
MAKRAEHLPAMPPQDPSLQVPSGLRVAYAKHLLDKHLRSLRYELNDDVSRNEPLPAIGHAPSHGHEDPLEHLSEYKGRVAIVGAGATGLYLAMMLKYLKISNVDIYEASDRIGGRVYTYEFDKDKASPHNYYDIGAMRIPEIDAMQSTLTLIEELKLPKTKYVLDAKCEPQMHWYSNTESPDGKPYDERMNEIIKGLGTNWDEKFEEWVKTGKDNHSTRGWLMFTDPKWAYDQTEEAESASTSTGLFEQSFVESLCDFSDFQATAGKPWWRLEGGMSVVTEKMNQCIKDPKWAPHNPVSLKVKKNTPVVAMTENHQENKIEVTITGAEGTKTEAYDMVFNTTAMGPLQRMDISGLVPGFGLPQTQRNILTGIRALSYDRSCKVAVKFKSRWWKNMYKASTNGSTFGGVSGSDLPSSNIVYPSWDDGDDASAVLMTSYTWAQDATRMGSLIPDYTKQKPHIDDAVVTQCFQDLVKLWGESKDPKITVEFLRNEYLEHHAFAWSHDPYTGGAFALFGPGQFSYIYPEFQQLLCDGKFAICGEALSPHHAWISGSLDSGYLTMLRWLFHLEDNDRADALKQAWFGRGKGEHTAEYDGKLMRWTVELSQQAAKRTRKRHY